MPTKSWWPTDLPRTTEVKSPTPHSTAVTGTPPRASDSWINAARTASRPGTGSAEEEVKAVEAFMGNSLLKQWPSRKGHFATDQLGHFRALAYDAPRHAADPPVSHCRHRPRRRARRVAAARVG